MFVKLSQISQNLVKINNIFQMPIKYNDFLNWSIQLIKTKPFLSAAAMFFTVGIPLLRYFHYLLVVHPSVGGRYNHQNTLGYRHPNERRLQTQQLQIKTSKNLTLRGWYMRHQDAENIVVYYHENAGNIGNRLYFIDQFMKNSKNSVIIVSYRGFSDSDGNSRPTENQIIEDSKAILRKSIQIAERDKKKLFVIGKSLGGAASIAVLQQPQFQNKVKGLILQNTFTCIYDVAINISILKYLKPLIWMVTAGSYDSLSKIGNIKVPILFIKGVKDRLVPKKLMDRLQQQCLNKKMQCFTYDVENGQHNNTWYVAGEEYFKIINEFLMHCSRI